MAIAVFLLVILLLALIGVLAAALMAVAQTSTRLAETALVQAQTTAVSATSNLLWQVLFILLCLGVLFLLIWVLWQRRQNQALQHRLESSIAAQSHSPRRWAPGPNAGWRRLEDPATPAEQLAPPPYWPYAYPPIYPPAYTVYPPHLLPPPYADHHTIAARDESIEHDREETNPFNFDL